MEPVPARPAIEQRLAEAGLPPLPRTAWLELDLDALRGNLAVIRELAGPGVPVRPVVKADAYGHGAVPIALALEAAGADGFCVAAFDEALELRDGGVQAPILVLYPVPAAWAVDAARLGVAVAVGDAAGVTEIVRAAEAHRRGATAGCRARGRDRARAGAGSPRPSWSPPHERSRRLRASP